MLRGRQRHDLGRFKSVTENFVIGPSLHGVYCDGDEPSTVTVPSAVDNAGRTIWIKVRGYGLVTIYAADLIDGLTEIPARRWSCTQLHSDGATWSIL